MEKEKVLVNFRTFKAYKDCFEFVAKKRGLSLTQYINQVLFKDVTVDILNTAMDNALQATALQYGLPNYLTIRYSKNREEELRAVLGDRYQEFGRDWAQLSQENIVKYFKEVGFDSNDSEYEAIMREFTENTSVKP
jgi:hypothetical protein